jgi:hypothetical protein
MSFGVARYGYYNDARVPGLCVTVADMQQHRPEQARP